MTQREFYRRGRVDLVVMTVLLLVLALITSCDTARRSDDLSISGLSDENRTKETLKMKLISSAFEQGATIPAKYTGVGDDVSPPLAWSGAPETTKSFALICDDPDAPSRANPRPEGPWVHWVIYNIPSDVAELPEGIPREFELSQPAGARQGKNDFESDNIGYRGPMPPPGSGPHRYFFHIYALDSQLDLDPKNATKQTLLNAMKGHILAEGELMGVFERQ